MKTPWPTTILSSVKQVAGVVSGLSKKEWICRGQAECYGTIIPTIDRGKLSGLSRSQKLKRERQSIERYRTSVQHFSDDGERNARDSDIVTLMVLRHFGVPTRLVDWTRSPHIAAYFASAEKPHRSGEIWTFDRSRYVDEGTKQWKRWKHMTVHGTGEGADFDYSLPSAFAAKQPSPWFVCYSYFAGFHRQKAQSGLWSLTGRFGLDHADAIANLLKDPACFHRYVIPAGLKSRLADYLRQRHGIWRGPLFPDSAGAAETAAMAFHVRSTPNKRLP